MRQQAAACHMRCHLLSSSSSSPSLLLLLVSSSSRFALFSSSSPAHFYILARSKRRKDHAIRLQVTRFPWPLLLLFVGYNKLGNKKREERNRERGHILFHSSLDSLTHVFIKCITSARSKVVTHMQIALVTYTLAVNEEKREDKWRRQDLHCRCTARLLACHSSTLSLCIHVTLSLSLGVCAISSPLSLSPPLFVHCQLPCDWNRSR